MQRPPFVHVSFVFARPPECFPLNNLQPGEIDLPLAEKIKMGLGETRSNASEEIDRLKKAGAYRGVRCGAAKQVGMFFGLCFDAIQRDGAHNQHGHCGSQLSKPPASASAFFALRIRMISRQDANKTRNSRKDAKAQRKEE